MILNDNYSWICTCIVRFILSLMSHTSMNLVETRPSRKVGLLASWRRKSMFVCSPQIWDDRASECIECRPTCSLTHTHVHRYIHAKIQDCTYIHTYTHCIQRGRGLALRGQCVGLAPTQQACWSLDRKTLTLSHLAWCKWVKGIVAYRVWYIEPCVHRTILYHTFFDARLDADVGWGSGCAEVSQFASTRNKIAGMG